MILPLRGTMLTRRWQRILPTVTDRPLLNLAIFNDTGSTRHYGCEMVMSALTGGLAAHDLRETVVDAVPVSIDSCDGDDVSFGVHHFQQAPGPFNHAAPIASATPLPRLN